MPLLRCQPLGDRRLHDHQKGCVPEGLYEVTATAGYGDVQAYDFTQGVNAIMGTEIT